MHGHFDDRGHMYFQKDKFTHFLVLFYILDPFFCLISHFSLIISVKRFKLVIHIRSIFLVKDLDEMLSHAQIKL